MVEWSRQGHERVRELCRRLRPILGKRMYEIHTAYSMEDSDGKKQLETYLESLTAKYLDQGIESTSVDLVPPSSNELSGSYELGTVEYAGKDHGTFGLRENEWIQHVGVFGRSGAGKTNLGFEIFRQLVKHDKPVLVFDWKRNYRDLLHRSEFKEVEVYTVGRDIAPLRFNPLIPPPGTEPKTWLKQLIEVVAHAYCLGDGVLYLLQETLDAVYEEAGVYSGHVTAWPTFHDVLANARIVDASHADSRP